MGMQSVRAKRGMGKESRQRQRTRFVVVRLRLLGWCAAGLRPGGTAEAAVSTWAFAGAAFPRVDEARACETRIR